MNYRHTILDDPALGYCELPEPDIESYLHPVFERAEDSPSLLSTRIPSLIQEEFHHLSRFLLLGERGGGTPIRLGLFAGLDAGQSDTVIALSRLLLQLELSPLLARDYAVFAYPLVNVRGFGTSQAPLVEFQHRYAIGSPDPDVQFFRSELSRWAYDGLITLRSTGVNRGFTATVRSEILGREVVEPALLSLADSVPIARDPVRVLPQDEASIQADRANGRLLPLSTTRPWPFEIELFVPGGVDCETRVRALFLAVVEILRRYRQFIAHGGEL